MSDKREGLNREEFNWGPRIPPPAAPPPAATNRWAGKRGYTVRREKGVEEEVPEAPAEPPVSSYGWTRWLPSFSRNANKKNNKPTGNTRKASREAQEEIDSLLAIASLHDKNLTPGEVGTIMGMIETDNVPFGVTAGEKRDLKSRLNRASTNGPKKANILREWVAKKRGESAYNSIHQKVMLEKGLYNAFRERNRQEKELWAKARDKLDHRLSLTYDPTRDLLPLHLFGARTHTNSTLSTATVANPYVTMGGPGGPGATVGRDGVGIEAGGTQAQLAGGVALVNQAVNQYMAEAQNGAQAQHALEASLLAENAAMRQKNAARLKEIQDQARFQKLAEAVGNVQKTTNAVLTKTDRVLGLTEHISGTLEGVAANVAFLRRNMLTREGWVTLLRAGLMDEFVMFFVFMVLRPYAPVSVENYAKPYMLFLAGLRAVDRAKKLPGLFQSPSLVGGIIWISPLVYFRVFFSFFTAMYWLRIMDPVFAGYFNVSPDLTRAPTHGVATLVGWARGLIEEGNAGRPAIQGMPAEGVELDAATGAKFTRILTEMVETPDEQGTVLRYILDGMAYIDDSFADPKNFAVVLVKWLNGTISFGVDKVVDSRARTVLAYEMQVLKNISKGQVWRVIVEVLTAIARKIWEYTFGALIKAIKEAIWGSGGGKGMLEGEAMGEDIIESGLPNKLVIYSNPTVQIIAAKFDMVSLKMMDLLLMGLFDPTGQGDTHLRAAKQLEPVLAQYFILSTFTELGFETPLLCLGTLSEKGAQQNMMAMKLFKLAINPRIKNITKNVTNKRKKPPSSITKKRNFGLRNHHV